MQIQRIAAFSEGAEGGNPAGVVLGPALPDVATMQRVAAEVGFSETAFAARSGESWRVRYFSPQSEVPFCGHATIALGAALARQEGDGVFPLTLNQAAITVEGRSAEGRYRAALQSPPTRSQAAPQELVMQALALFGYRARGSRPAPAAGLDPCRRRPSRAVPALTAVARCHAL